MHYLRRGVGGGTRCRHQTGEKRHYTRDTRNLRSVMCGWRRNKKQETMVPTFKCDCVMESVFRRRVGGIRVRLHAIHLYRSSSLEFFGRGSWVEVDSPERYGGSWRKSRRRMSCTGYSVCRLPVPITHWNFVRRPLVFCDLIIPLIYTTTTDSYRRQLNYLQKRRCIIDGRRIQVPSCGRILTQLQSSSLSFRSLTPFRMAPLGEALRVVYEGDREQDASSMGTRTSVYRGTVDPEWTIGA